jgi:hypothetical protein
MRPSKILRVIKKNSILHLESKITLLLKGIEKEPLSVLKLMRKRHNEEGTSK